MKRIEWLQTATLEEVAMLLVHEGVHIGFDYVYDGESAINHNIEFLKEEI